MFAIPRRCSDVSVSSHSKQIMHNSTFSEYSLSLREGVRACGRAGGWAGGRARLRGGETTREIDSGVNSLSESSTIIGYI